ncbi:hypothetical protein OIU77_025498 [Salix suchowensis]|uniref:Uncharacterized protein n=1 Tax=Salix suchowensis TaxID=1278906 RepID=A0ABQ9BWG6_9ROSI|nr:hypothetical protein OIU77_025498 [Salix suchowensis]
MPTQHPPHPLHRPTAPLQGLTTTRVTPSTQTPSLNCTLCSCLILILTLGTTVRLPTSCQSTPRATTPLSSLHSLNPSFSIATVPSPSLSTNTSLSISRCSLTTSFNR